MNVETHMNPTYTLNLTQDEYVAIIVAIFSSTKETINKSYNGYFSSQILDNIDKELDKLAGAFQHTYQKEKLIDVIKTVRLDGFEFLKGN